MSHHSSDGPFDPARTSEMMKKLLGEFPAGKLNPQDEGALALEIGTSQGRVVMQFPKPVKWIGFTPQEAIGIAETLIAQAQLCGCKEPLTFSIPSRR